MLLRHLSMDLMKRVHGNYRFVISFNLGLILLGVAGIITPSMSALLHNSGKRRKESGYGLDYILNYKISTVKQM